MNRSIFTVALMMALLVFSGGVQAEKLPKHYPESFQSVGEIDEIGKGFIVIDDMELSLKPSTQVHTPRTRFSTLNVLKKGLQIGYTSAGERQETAGEVTEIWVLPKHFKYREH